MIQIYIMIMIIITYSPTLIAKSSTLRGLFGGSCAGALIGGVAGKKQGAAIGALTGGLFGTAIGASKDIRRSHKKRSCKECCSCSHKNRCQKIYEDQQDDRDEEHERQR